MDKSIVGKVETVTYDAKMISDGSWGVTMTVIHKRTMNGSDWETKSAQMSSFSPTYTGAVATVTQSMSIYMLSVNFDLFKESDDKTNSSKDKES